jgi:hypothetical protein
MSKVFTTRTSIRRMATTLALAAGLAVPQLAIAQNYTPAAQPGVVNQDYRSPDARSAAATLQNERVFPQQAATDLRSPDARESGRFLTATPQVQAADTSNGGVDWLNIALGSALALLIAGGIVVTARRHRHELGFGH